VNYDLTEEQESVRDLAARIFGDRATADRVKEIEAGEERVDRALWSELANAGLLGVCLPESAGGAGLDLLTLVLLLEQQGRRVAPVPLLPVITAARALADGGADVANVIAGESFVAPAIWEAHAADPYRPTTTAVDSYLTGFKPSVMGAHVADRLVVTARDGVYVVDPTADGVTLERAIATSREVVTHVRLEGAPAERIGDVDALHRLVDAFTLGLCALTIGVCEEANAQAAEYTSNRHQFGKPLSAFQGTAHKAADSYIDTEALRVVTWQAAWRMDEGRDDPVPPVAGSPARAALLAAKWHATEAGHFVTHRTQHLHGGMGADIDYPVHRYFQWGKQLAVTLGGATETLARLGDVLVGASA
jgi:acyl-CoA dehydrogenase